MLPPRPQRWTILCRVHFLWTRRTGMLPFIWLAYQVWFLWASPAFVHSDDSFKKSVAFPLVPGLCDCIAVPLLPVGNFMGYPTRCKLASTHASRSPWKYSCVLRLRATSILILENCSSFDKNGHTAIALALWKSMFYTLQYIDRLLSPLAALTHLIILVRVYKPGCFRTHHCHVIAVFPVLFIQPL